jgi:hypothetical protein
LFFAQRSQPPMILPPRDSYRNESKYKQHFPQRKSNVPHAAYSTAHERARHERRV